MVVKLSDLQNSPFFSPTLYMYEWYEVVFTTVGRHCRIRLKGMLCDAERDLLAIVKFLVVNVSHRTHTLLVKTKLTG